MQQVQHDNEGQQSLADSIMNNPKVMKSKYLKENLKKLMNNPCLCKDSTLIVSVNGNTNSGKTSFLNSLMSQGVEIFPTSDQPNTFQLFALRNNHLLDKTYNIYQVEINKKNYLNFNNKKLLKSFKDRGEVNKEIIELNKPGTINFYVIETKLRDEFEDRDILLIDPPGASAIINNEQQSKALKILNKINYHIWLHLVPSKQLYQKESSLQDIFPKNEFTSVEYGIKKHILLMTNIQEIHDIKKLEEENFDQEENNKTNEAELEIQIKNYLDKQLDSKKNDIMEFIKKQNTSVNYNEVWQYCSKLKSDFRGHPTTGKVIGCYNAKLYDKINSEYDKTFLLSKKNKQLLELLRTINQNLAEPLEQFKIDEFKQCVESTFQSIEQKLNNEKKDFIRKNKQIKDSKEFYIKMKDLETSLQNIILNDFQSIHEKSTNIESLILLNLIELGVVNLEELLNSMSRSNFNISQGLPFIGLVSLLIRLEMRMFLGSSGVGFVLFGVYRLGDYIYKYLYENEIIVDKLYRQFDKYVKKNKEAMEWVIKDLELMKK